MDSTPFTPHAARRTAVVALFAGPFGRAMAIVRRIIGVPDYAVYLRHAAECHPGVEPLTEDEFLEERLEAKYSRPGQRCC